MLCSRIRDSGHSPGSTLILEHQHAVLSCAVARVVIGVIAFILEKARNADRKQHGFGGEVKNVDTKPAEQSAERRRSPNLVQALWLDIAKRPTAWLTPRLNWLTKWIESSARGLHGYFWASSSLPLLMIWRWNP